MPNRQRGFTLLEFVVVVVIVVVSAAILVPNYIKISNHKKCGADICAPVVVTQPEPPTILLPRGEEFVAAVRNPHGPTMITTRQQVPNSPKVLFKLYLGKRYGEYATNEWEYKPIPSVILVQDATPAPIKAEVNNCEPPK